MKKTAIVTGSTSGIGRGAARALAAAGANVMLNGLGEAAEVEELRTGFAPETGAEVAFCGPDRSRVAEIERLAAEPRERFGAIDGGWTAH